MDEKYPAVLLLQAGGRVPIAGLFMCIIVMILVYCGARGIAKVLSMNLLILLSCDIQTNHRQKQFARLKTISPSTGLCSTSVRT